MKPCPFCAESIQDAAIKCRFCGSLLSGTAVAAPKAADTSAAETLFEGRPSWLTRLGVFVGSGLLIGGGIAAAVALPIAFGVAVEWGAAAGGALALLGLVWLASAALQRRSVLYRITTRAIDVESGVLGRRIETLPLWKVRDLELRQSLVDRMLGLASVRVYTQDVTDPQLELRGLEGARALFERLKTSVESARQSRNVLGIIE